jgi:hypothetical protein
MSSQTNYSRLRIAVLYPVNLLLYKSLTMRLPIPPLIIYTIHLRRLSTLYLRYLSEQA